MTDRDIKIGDYVSTEEKSGTVLKTLDDIGDIILDTGTELVDIDIENIVKISDVRDEDVEGISKEEITQYQDAMSEIQQKQGQPAKGTHARIAISAMDRVWTLDDIVELSGASRDVVRRVVEQELIRGFVKQIGKAKTQGRAKAIYITLANRGDSEW